MADETPPNPAPTPSPAPPAGGVAASLANEALKAAQAAIASLKQNVPSAAPAAAVSADEAATTAPAPVATMPAPASQAAPAPMPAFERSISPEAPKGIDLLSDVNLNVKIELGRARMVVEDVLKLAEGAVVELDKLAGDPVDVYVNERHIARGEVLVLNDNFCVRINEIVADVTDGHTPGAKGKK